MKTYLTILLAIVTAVLGLHAPTAHADGKVVIPDDLKQRVETEGWSQQWHDELYGHEDMVVGTVLRQMLRAKRDAAALESGLVVHEWGSMQHHLGGSMSEFDVLGESQSDLPSFVKVWSKQPSNGPRIMRKPILYFYTKEPKKINVTVRFPEGLLTQWYPDVTVFSPQRNDLLLPNNQALPRNSTLSWQQVELNPDFPTDQFAGVNQNHPWWHIARETDATPLRITTPRSGQATERFLFYRGAGTYEPMVKPKRDDEGEGLSVTVPFSQIDLRGVFLVRVNDSGATITHAPLLRAEKTLTLAGPEAVKPTKEAAELAKMQLIESLEAAGLFPKEATGLVKIWGDDFFTKPGERLLYLMPNNEVERVLPLTVDPEPKQTVRTLIAWVEIATPEAEKRIKDLVEQLISPNHAKPNDAKRQLHELDRFAEAILRRTMEETEDKNARAQIQQILTTLNQKRMQGNQ